MASIATLWGYLWGSGWGGTVTISTEAWLGLFTVQPDGDTGTEAPVSRVLVSAWENIADNGQANRLPIDVPIAEDVTVTGWGLWEAESGGDPVTWGTFDRPDRGSVALTVGDTLQFEPGGLQIYPDDTIALWNIWTEDYLPQAQQLLPPEFGGGFNRRPGTVLTNLLTAMMREFSRIDSRALQLQDEFFPDTAVETLERWEDFAGLYQDFERPTSLASRQAILAAKLRGAEFFNEAYFIGLAEDLGYTSVSIDYPDSVGAWTLNATSPNAELDPALTHLVETFAPANTAPFVNIT